MKPAIEHSAPEGFRELPPQQKRLLLAKLLQQRTNVSPAPSDDLPTLRPRPDLWYEPFPLTDVQQAYWLGQTELFGLGNVATHLYSELDSNELDPERIVTTYNRLIRYHPMLRAVVQPDGTQRILRDVPEFQPRIIDLRGLPAAESHAELERIRAELSHQVLPPARWPLFDGCISLRDRQLVRLHLSFSLLILDAWSIRLLLAQWALLYQFPHLELPNLDVSFRDYVVLGESRKSAAVYERARQYWLDRLPHLPAAPELPLVCRPGEIQRPQFARRASSVDAARWSRIKDAAAERGFTPSAVLLACFSEILRTWSRSARFTVNLTLFNRPAVHPQIGDLVGDFTSLTLFAADCSQTETFCSRVRRLQDQLGRDLDHLEMSGVAVLRELWRLHGRDPATVMPIVFTSMVGKSSPADEIPFGEAVYGISQTPQVWLDHQIVERGGAIYYNWDYVEELFPAGMIPAMFQAYTEFLQRLAEEPSAWDDRERIHLPETQRQQRRAINATERSFRNVRLESLFFEQEARSPNATAVATANRSLTYGELGCHVRRIAARLQKLHVRPNTLVAVVMEKGWEQVAAVLGILHAGAAYLPIDLTLPAERIAYLLSNGEVSVALTQNSWCAAEIWPNDVTKLIVDDSAGDAVPEAPVPTAASTDDLAYVIFTSGSTGQPKGVMISHRAAVNTILDMNERFQIAATDRVLALSALSFDLSVYDIFGLLAAGGTIVVPEACASRDPDRWLDQMHREHITVWNTVPSLMEMVVEVTSGGGRAGNRTLRRVFLSGDWIPVTLPDRIRAAFPDAEVVSLGGATEAAIWSIYHHIEQLPANAASVPYGQPLANQSWHILHADGLPCPEWVPGELYIGGTGLALGYWKDAEKTAQRFVCHPQTGERLYRTGDLGRYLPNGDIEFLGREDTQVKILGHRIELGEIETALMDHPEVQAAIVCAIGDPRGSRRLVAHVIPTGAAKSGTNSDASARWTAFLRQKLPPYMIPGEFVLQTTFPLTPNGKVDRPALSRQAVESGCLSQTDTAPPSADWDAVTLEVLAVISAEMGLPNLSATDNLMHVGANSIDMIRLANRFETEYGFRPNLAEFFRVPTVQGLAELLRSHRAGKPAESTQSTASRPLTAVILDPQERAEFKQHELGRRAFAAEAVRIALPERRPDDVRRAAAHMRRSRRDFATHPISFHDWCAFLEVLDRIVVDGQVRYGYGSAGGLYPVQTYLHLKPNAVEGLAHGLYYYDAVGRSLVAIAPGIELNREIHQAQINQPVFDRASFSIFLVGVPAAIEPLYGDLSRQFTTLEAGAMTQLLEESALRRRIGLCQIGWLDFDRIRPLFGLAETDWLVHSLLGGPIESATATAEAEHVPGRSASPDGDYEEGEL